MASPFIHISGKSTANYLVPLEGKDDYQVQCLNPKKYYISCSEYHYKRMYARCRKCVYCLNLRKRSIYVRALQRYDAIPDGLRPKIISMWTLGTSLHDTVTNRKILSSYWQSFANKMRKARLRKKLTFSPQLWAVESGTRSSRLHIHVLAFGYTSHNFVLQSWRSTTQEESNVHFRVKSRNDPKRAVAYITKYLNKENSPYYWCGLLLTSSKNKLKDTWACSHCGSGWLATVFHLSLPDDMSIFYYVNLEYFYLPP